MHTKPTKLDCSGVEQMQNSPTSNPFFLNLIDRKQLAANLGVSPSFISKLMVEQGLPHIKLGRAVRYDLREVMAFLNERKFP